MAGVKQLKWEAARECKFNNRRSGGGLHKKQKHSGRTVKRLQRGAAVKLHSKQKQQSKRRTYQWNWYILYTVVSLLLLCETRL